MGIITGNVDERANINTQVVYTIERAGKALAQFLTCVDTIDTEIGEYKKPYKMGADTYIVSGVQITTNGSPVAILSDLSTNLEVTGKFNHFMGKPAIQVLKAYLDTLGNDKVQYKQAVQSRFRDIVGNRKLVAPFRPKESCIVNFSDGKTTHKNETTQLYSLLWSTDRESGKIQGKMLVSLDNAGAAKKTYKIDLSEYGEALRFTTIEDCMKTDKIDRRTVSMTRFGFIKPIVVKDKNITLALDGSSLYLIHNNTITIIGQWGDNGELIESTIAKNLSKHKAYKHIKTNLAYIEKHRRFIAPYGLTEAVEINI